MKTDENGLVICGISVFKFLFYNVGLGLTNSEMDNLWEQMLLVGGKKQMSDPKK
jgi:hypothetical protein